MPREDLRRVRVTVRSGQQRCRAHPGHVALYFALGLIAFVVGAVVITTISFGVPYVRRPADREDLRKLIEAWRGR